MNKKYLSCKSAFYLLVASHCISIPSFASTTLSTSMPIMASGYYRTDFDSELPLLGISKDRGTTWHYPSDITSIVLPSPYKVGVLNGGVFCANELCITTGYYGDGRARKEFPLLAVSKDKGTAWTYPSSIINFNLPSSSKANLSSGASCSGNTCIATGYIYDFNTQETKPLLALTQDSGESWSYPFENTPSILPPSTQSAEIYHPICTGTTCMAAGYYYNGRKHPLLILSSDSGTSWSYSTDVATLPFSYIRAELFDASCSDTICIISGYYDDFLNKTRPLLALSRDKGLTWTYSEDISSTALPSNYSNSGELTGGASCSGTICIATGRYDARGRVLPLLALTKDAGVTWSYPKDITDKLPIKDLQTSEFTSASCNGTTCVATGYYIDINNRFQPLLAVTTDAGESWFYPPELRVSSLPESGTSAALYNANCNDEFCIATGYVYFKGRYAPLVAMSNDKGRTWSYTSLVTINENWPSSYPGGSFMGKINSGSASFHPEQGSVAKNP